jgi:hypothetical protein
LGTTSRFGLHYPDLTDAPHGPAQLQQLADDADTWLCRAFRCTSTTRPAGVPDDFIIRESDTGNIMIWTGSTWAQINGTVSSGGGGGGTGGGTSLISTISATYAATSAQTIPTSTDTVVAFGVEQVADSAVTRSTSGSGHRFTLAQNRLWTVSFTGRFPTNTDTGGRTFEIRAGSTVLAKAGTQTPTDNAWTANLSVTRKLAAGTAITVIARHSAGTSLPLEPSGGSYLHIDIAGV